MPQGNPNIPPGLEYLTMIDQLLVHQKVELLEGEMSTWCCGCVDVATFSGCVDVATLFCKL